MTFSLEITDTTEKYRRPFRLRGFLYLSIALIFIVPFLAFIEIEYLYLTLIPWISASCVVIYNYHAGRASKLNDPVILRDGFIEIDQYPSIRAALRDDRFVDLHLVDSVEVIQFVTTYHKRGNLTEDREKRRIVFHMKDGRDFTIDRQIWIIDNSVNAIEHWIRSQATYGTGKAEENEVEFSPLYCDWNQIGLPSHSRSWRNKIFGLGMMIVFISVFISMVLILGPQLIKDDLSSGTFLTITIMIVSVLFILRATEMFTDGFTTPKMIKPMGMTIDKDSITIWFLDGRPISFPWLSIRGLMATSTEDYPHPFILDGLFFSEDLGAIAFDEYLFDLKIDIADKIQSIYLRKFGFYPNKYWYRYNRMATDNFPQLQRRPKSI